jgi:hypothetical protein
MLVEWLKVNALSSNPSTAKKEKKKVLYVFMLTVEIRTNIKSFIISKRSVCLFYFHSKQKQSSTLGGYSLHNWIRNAELQVGQWQTGQGGSTGIALLSITVIMFALLVPPRL